MTCGCPNKHKIGTLQGEGVTSTSMLLDVYKCESCGELSLDVRTMDVPTIAELVAQAKKKGGASFEKDFKDTEERNMDLKSHYDYHVVRDGRTCENLGKGPNRLHGGLTLEVDYVYEGKILETHIFCDECLERALGQRRC